MYVPIISRIKTCAGLKGGNHAVPIFKAHNGKKPLSAPPEALWVGSRRAQNKEITGLTATRHWLLAALRLWGVGALVVLMTA
jgi:hypothetical protein